MKDARGHGSNKTNGISVINPNGSNIAKAIAARNAMFGSGYTSAPGVKVNTAWGAANGVPSAVKAAGGQPAANNADAAAQLASGPKSAPAPIHDSMGSGQSVSGARYMDEVARIAQKVGRTSLKDIR